MIRLVDIHGNGAAYYEYDPYGNAIYAGGSHANINPLRYRGYVYDTDTGLYYLQSRYYDPSIGRYINRDVVFDYNVGLRGYNLFAYCGNSPVFRVDPYGRTSVGAEEDADPTNDIISEKDGGGTGVNSGIPSTGTTAGTGTWNAFRRTLQSAADGLAMAAGTHKGFQKHHMLSDKNKTYSPQYKEITDRYNLELDQDWNTLYLNNHRGRHTNAYHQFMLEAVHYVDDVARGDPYKFVEGMGIVSEFLTENTWIPYAQ